MNENNILKNTTEGYGYKYTSLSGIAEQGNIIPKMKVGTDEHNLKDYVYYYDKELNEWIRGAEIVVPENIITKDGKEKLNSAQRYGSALTYARRYTTLMALQLVCEDDKAIENGLEQDLITEKQMNLIRSKYGDKLGELLSNLQLNDLSEMSKTKATEIISKIMGNKNDNNKSK